MGTVHQLHPQVRPEFPLLGFLVRVVALSELLAARQLVPTVHGISLMEVVETARRSIRTSAVSGSREMMAPLLRLRAFPAPVNSMWGRAVAATGLRMVLRVGNAAGTWNIVNGSGGNGAAVDPNAGGFWLKDGGAKCPSTSASGSGSGNFRPWPIERGISSQRFRILACAESGAPRSRRRYGIWYERRERAPRAHPTRQHQTVRAVRTHQAAGTAARPKAFERADPRRAAPAPWQWKPG